MKDEDGIIAMLCYLIPFIGGIAVYLTRKGSYERFHAVQSILFWGAVVAISIALQIIEIVFGLIPVIGKVLGPLLDLVSLIFGLAVLVIWFLLMWRTYEKKRWELPVLTRQAERYAK